MKRKMVYQNSPVEMLVSLLCPWSVNSFFFFLFVCALYFDIVSYGSLCSTFKKSSILNSTKVVAHFISSSSSFYPFSWFVLTSNSKMNFFCLSLPSWKCAELYLVIFVLLLNDSWASILIINGFINVTHSLSMVHL